MTASFLPTLLHGTRRVWARTDWLEALGADWPNFIMTVAATDDFHAKQGRSTCRWEAPLTQHSLSVYLKRHYRLPRLLGLLATLWPSHPWSPGFQEWHHLQWAQAQGIPVPTPVASAQYVGSWGKLQSVLVIEDLVGMLPLHQAAPLASQHLPSQVFGQWKRSLVREMVRLTRILHGQAYFHQDLYLCHFYLPQADIFQPPADFRGRLHMIDFHRLVHRPWLSCWWQIKDLAQLLYSSEVPGVTLRDRLRFWYLYREGQPRSAVRWLEWAIRLKWRRYRNHNLKRKATQLPAVSEHKEAAA